MDTKVGGLQVARSCIRLNDHFNNANRTAPAFDTGWALGRYYTQCPSTKKVSRSEQGELVYRMKYCHDRLALDIASEQMIQRVSDRLSEMNCDASIFDAIIPVPPSRVDRPFQPAIELARRLAAAVKIDCDTNLLSKVGKLESMKSMEGYKEKVEHLRGVLRVADRRYAGKRVLVIDDIVDSGATLDTVARMLKSKGGVERVHVLCSTATLTMR